VSTDPEEKAFLAASKAVLDESARDLEPEVATRLRQARYRALETKSKSLRWLVPASGFAAVSVAIFAAALWLFQPSRIVPVQSVEDLEILSSSENLELFDDLEFYHWLAEQNQG